MKMVKKVPERYEYQQKALDFITGKDFFALFMEQGTGKSKVAIDKTFELYMDGKVDCAIVISPNAVKEQWIVEQFEEHFPTHNWENFLWEGKDTEKQRKIFKDKIFNKEKFFVFSINVEAFQSNKIDKFVKFTLKNRKVKVIIDESTRIKNGRRKPVRGKRGGAKRTNKILDMFKEIKYKCILTGTPTPNSPFDLWSQFEFLKVNFFERDYFFFKNHYGILIKKSFQGRSFNVTLDERIFNIIKNRLKIYNSDNKLTHRILEDMSAQYGVKISDIMIINKMDKFTGYKNLKELKEKISPVTFFVKKEDCLDLPDKVFEKLYCPMGTHQKEIYKTLKRNMYAEYEGKEITIINKVVMALRLQMVTGGLFPWLDTDIKINKDGEEFFDTEYKFERLKDCGKVKVLLEDLEEVSIKTSIIIWARFRGEIELIESKLLEKGYTCDKYYGGSEYNVIDRFKNKEFRILIASPQKGGEGLNLQISTLQYFYSNSFRADSRLQAEDRSHRIGQTNKVTYKDLICKGTIDERVYDILKRKENLIDYFRTNNNLEFLQ